MTLLHLSYNCNFVHNDIKSKNVFLSKIDEDKTQIFSINNGEFIYTLKNGFKLVFADFDKSMMDIDIGRKRYRLFCDKNLCLNIYDNPIIQADGFGDYFVIPKDLKTWKFQCLLRHRGTNTLISKQIDRLFFFTSMLNYKWFKVWAKETSFIQIILNLFMDYQSKDIFMTNFYNGRYDPSQRHFFNYDINNYIYVTDAPYKKINYDFDKFGIIAKFFKDFKLKIKIISNEDWLEELNNFFGCNEYTYDFCGNLIDINSVIKDFSNNMVYVINNGSLVNSSNFEYNNVTLMCKKNNNNDCIFLDSNNDEIDITDSSNNFYISPILDITDISNNTKKIIFDNKNNFYKEENSFLIKELILSPIGNILSIKGYYFIEDLSGVDLSGIEFIENNNGVIWAYIESDDCKLENDKLKIKVNLKKINWNDYEDKFNVYFQNSDKEYEKLEKLIENKKNLIKRIKKKYN